MNNLKAITLIGLTIALAAMLGHDTATAGIDAGGKPRASKGSLSAFGSIYVNGVRYNTDNTLFIIDGAFGTESDLSVGQVVTVFGDVEADGATGTANVVISRHVVVGPISFVDAVAGRLAVLGQQVIVGPGVASLAEFGHGDVVAVSGHVNAYGEVMATRIDSASAGDDFDVMGTVSFVDDADYILGINGLLVDYAAANVYGFAAGSPEPGQTVQVSGSGIDAGGMMVANQVSAAAPAVSGPAGESADVEGHVTTYAAPWSFSVDGTPVTIDWGTRFEGGWIFDLGLDRKLEVEGEFDAAGRIVADRIVFDSEATHSIRGYVDAVDGNTVVVDGMAVQMRDDTEYEDHSDYNERRFTAANLYAGDYVEIYGYSDGGQQIATRLERHDDDDDDDEDEDDDDGDDDDDDDEEDDDD